MEEEEKIRVFGRRLENLMEEENINQTELADRLNTTSSSVSAYVLGKNTPRIDVLIKICEIFDVSFDYLFGYSNAKKQVFMQGIVEIPILKSFEANENNFRDSNVERILYATKERFVNSENVFGMIVRQQSMRPRFYEGDIVIVERTKSVNTGDIVMITIGNDSAIIRELVITPSGWVLNPFTPLTPPTFYSWEDIESQNIRLIGKVVESVVKF